MSDVFKIDWRKRMKKETVSHGFLNAKPLWRVTIAGPFDDLDDDQDVEDDDDARFEFYESKQEAIKKWPKNALADDYDPLELDVNQVEIRHGLPKQMPIYGVKFWRYKAPKSIYNLHQPSLR